MSGWEQPRSRRADRLILAVLAVVTAAAAALAGVALTRPPPTDQLEVTPVTATEAPAVLEDSSWQPPTPGRWRRLPIAPLASRIGHTMVWTGNQVIVWGGFDHLGRPLTDGASFDPRTGAWRMLPDNGATDSVAVGVWTGDHLALILANDTFLYQPERRRWRTAPRLPLPGGHRLTRYVFAAGSSVVAVTAPYAENTEAGIFMLDDRAGRWQRLPDLPVRLTAAAVVVPDGGDVLLFAPASDVNPTGALRLDPHDARPSWRPVDGPPGLDGRQLRELVGVAADGRIVLWGASGDGRPNYAATRDDTGWTRLDPGPLAATWAADALWLGDEMIVWDRLANAGALLDPVGDRWMTLPAPPIPAELPRPTVWTGSSIFTWGALGSGGAMFAPGEEWRS